MSELESLGLETPKLNELNDSYEVENLVDYLKQMLYEEYESTHVYTDWQIMGCTIIIRFSGQYVDQRALISNRQPI